MSARLEGLPQVMENLNRELRRIENRSMAGLMAAGFKVQRLAQQRTPVEYGNLRASGFTRKAQGDPRTVEVGFTAAYAVYVHENVGETLKGQPRKSGIGVYWGPQGRSKFLESALNDLTGEIVQTVLSYANVRSRTG